MKIITRLKFAQIICILILVVVMGLFVRTTLEMRAEIGREEVASEVLHGVTDLRYLTLEYVLYHQPRTQRQWELRWSSLQQLIDQAQGFSGTDAALLQNLRDTLRRFGTMFGELRAVHGERLAAPDKLEQQNILGELEARLTGRMLARVQTMAGDADELARLSRARILGVQRTSAIVIGALGTLAVLVVVFAMLMTVRSVAGPLARLHRATEAVAVNNLRSAPAQHAQDEIGDLARAFDGMMERLRVSTVSRDALVEANTALQSEVAVRLEAERKVHAQLARMSLLQQITRSIEERQDLRSIYQVVVRSLEDQLPVDFGAILRYSDGALQVDCVGVRSAALALSLAMPEAAQVPIDANGLSHCVAGELVYEPDIGVVAFPFPRRLAEGGLASLVLAPLLAESKVFGVLVVARREACAFSSGDCEFLLQLSEHVALAAHQVQLYEALQRAYDELNASQLMVTRQERLRALGQMASGIAHDINNAISPISLYAESLLETEHGLSVKGRDNLEVMARAIDDVAATVARMREFYRQREPQLALSTVDLNTLIQHAADLTRARWSDIPQQRGVVIDLRLEMAAELPFVLGVEGEIREALTNLIFNGIDAMPDGGVLTLRSLVADGQVQVEVSDTGCGMDEATQTRCMEPFFTTKGERGTGLGMAMVYGMVQRHGGKVSIRSAPQQGTTVRLSFPVAQQAPAPDLAPDQGAGPPLRILLVDDDPTVLASLSDVLGRDGHTVTAADGGQAGIDCLRTALAQGCPFEVVITDLGMPYVDGRKVAETAKSLSPGLPVILLTGWGQRVIPDAAGGMAHVDRVLSKPPKIRELREALRKCVAPEAQA